MAWIFQGRLILGYLQNARQPIEPRFLINQVVFCDDSSACRLHHRPMLKSRVGCSALARDLTTVGRCVGGSQPTSALLMRRKPCQSSDLRHNHGMARIFVRLAIYVGCIRSISRMISRIRHAVRNRPVSSTCRHVRPEALPSRADVLNSLCGEDCPPRTAIIAIALRSYWKTLRPQPAMGLRLARSSSANLQDILCRRPEVEFISHDCSRA